MCKHLHNFWRLLPNNKKENNDVKQKQLCYLFYATRKHRNFKEFFLDLENTKKSSYFAQIPHISNIKSLKVRSKNVNFIKIEFLQNSIFFTKNNFTRYELGYDTRFTQFLKFSNQL